MAPTPQELTIQKPEEEKSRNTVVITGMSGVFPNSPHIKELADVLYNKKNSISSNPPWKYNHPEVAQYIGKVPNLTFFDAQFFKVHYKQAQSMDAMSRKLLEQSYQAIYDAGVSPEHLSGRKVGVYIGSCFAETEKAAFYVLHTRNGFGISGCNKSMFANRISYWLNSKGPSLSIDEACCSSLAALELAYLALSRGDCEAAIVGGGSICLHPQSSVHFSRLMSLSMDGKTKSFDENAAGCVKSEAISVLFLQKPQDALRIYAELVLVKNQFTYLCEEKSGPRYGFYRNPTHSANFLNSFYKQAQVPPQTVEYVEAFGSADPEADKAELESLDEVFCKNRNNELLVGSVMSNIGYGEAASGMSAVAKVLLGYHKGSLAANLNLDNPRRDVAALRDGRIRLLTDNRPFGRTYAAINALSFTGVNAHVLLNGHYKPKDLFRYKSNIPYLVPISARQDVSVSKVLSYLKSRPIDPEELALLHNIHSTSISGHLGRGFTILDTNEEKQTVSLRENASYFDNVQRPLWFVYSGMGSQWVGMGRELMRIPVFASAIERCHRVLHPKGVDIVDIITTDDKSTFDNILNSFVGIAAIQIGLTDVLLGLGLQPDNIIGHSVGELGCAYADGCFTVEEMILAAFYRGLVSVQTPFIRGSMAAVGIGYKQAIMLCPPEVAVACHNGPDSCTISGPADIMKTFVAELTAKHIFAKEVPCSNIAYHSKYIAEAGPELLKHLKQVITNPKLRSERWLSTSVPQEEWNEPMAKYSSAEYHTNNLLSAVLFEETSRLIPANAVIVEVAPHGLLQAILKRSLPQSCSHVPVTRRGHPDNVLFLLEAIGRLYLDGYNINAQALYPKIEFPVSTETPFLSHLVEWAHQEKWAVPIYMSALRQTASSCKFVYSIHDLEHKFLAGHVIKGINTFPFSAALVAVWDVLAMKMGVLKKTLSVEFHDVKFYSQPVLHDQRLLRLFISIHRGNGHFEIMDEWSKVAVGRITGELVNTSRFEMEFRYPEEFNLNSRDTYHLLSKRGYSYSDDFQSIYEVNKSLTKAQIYWRNNWVTFIDGMLQLSTLRNAHDDISNPIYIRRIVIDTKRHANAETKSIGNDSVINAHIFEINNLIRCGGIAIEDVKFRNLPKCIPKPDLLALEFFPFFQPSKSEISRVLLVYLQILAENLNTTYINIIELSNIEQREFDVKRVIETFHRISPTKILHEVILRNQFTENNSHYSGKVDVLLLENLSVDNELRQILYQVLANGSFIINKETCGKDLSFHNTSELYHVLCAQHVKDLRFELVRWNPKPAPTTTIAFTLRSPSDLELLSSTITTLPEQHRIIIITSYPYIDGFKARVQKWRKNRSLIHVISSNHQILDDQHTQPLPNNDFTFNVLNEKEWGGWFYVPLSQKQCNTQDISLQCSHVGDFSSLHWVEMSKIIRHGVLVDVHYAGICSIDVKRCAGIIPQESGHNKFGMDFSGVTECGQLVMGLISGGAASSRIIAHPELLWPVPEYWSLEDAATVPLAYYVAFYCLCIKLKLQSGMVVLIHGGAGAIGQAAISIALGNGCTVFTTVSDVSKKLFIRKLFPQIEDDHIGQSRDYTFSDMVLTRTNSNGCHIVLSCVTGDLINESLKCSGFSGVTVDLIPVATRDNYCFQMNSMTIERSYITIDFMEILSQENINVIKKLQVLMSEGIKHGYVRPLSRVTYTPSDAPRAFRLLAASRHRGRVLLQLRVNAQINLVSQPRLLCSEDHVHLVLCDNDYFGVLIAERLVKYGARKIYLHDLKKSSYLDFDIQSLKERHVHVKTSNLALNCNADVDELINDCASIGPIEGIYVIIKKKISLRYNLVQDLDKITRKLCPELKYFGIVSGVLNDGFRTSISRYQNKLPVTLIQLPTINMEDNYKINTGKESIFNENSINSFEYALSTKAPIVTAIEDSRENRSLWEDIARVADIKMAANVDENLTLYDMKLESNQSQIICTYLKNYHNISISEKDLLDLTIKRIREIDQNMKFSEFKDTKGLKTFFSYVDPDELLATTEMIFLPTIVNNSNMRSDELDVTQTYLVIIPGLEGHYERFRTLCEQLKISAIILQPGLERPDETVTDLAKRFAQVLLKKAGLNKKFYLMGYESGTLVALEMASVLEDHGLTGTVFLIGDSPDRFYETLNKMLKEYQNEEEMQIAIALHMCNLMVDGHTDGLEDELREKPTWAEKIGTCVRSILGRVSHSAQYTQDTIECAYGRIKQLQAYRPTPRPLSSQLILIQAASSSEISDHSIHDYSLQPVTVYQLRTPLAHSVADLRCSAIINSHLDNELLAEFEKRNLCDAYLLNSDKFLTMGPAYDSNDKSF